MESKQLLKLWLRKPVQELSVNFNDQEFPATISSITGRKYRSGGINANDISQRCACGQPPRLKQVYKDGVNQGRYFFSCASSKCNYFAWDDGKQTPVSNNIHWARFTAEDGWTMVANTSFCPAHVLQGGVGDCWFLSALAVVAERDDLISNIVVTRPHLDPSGQSTFRLFIDGDWRLITVDNYLPCKQKTSGKRKVSDEGSVEVLAFAKPYKKLLWVPLLEKAYAKAHGTLASHDLFPLFITTPFFSSDDTTI